LAVPLSRKITSASSIAARSPERGMRIFSERALSIISWCCTNNTKTLRDNVNIQCEYFICNSPLRCLNDHEGAREFVALWKSAESPGLTATQRDRFLSQLKCESVA